MSCRNLLIYLLPDAQAKVISLFHFALREGGLLLLGNSESIGDAAGSFEVVSKTERLFRRIGGRRAVLEGYSMGRGEGPRVPARQEGNGAHARRETLASLCQRLLAEEFGPAAALVNLKHECLYFSGRTDDFLKVAPGAAVNDILSMARDGVRAKLRLALQRAAAEQKKVTVTGGRMIRDGVDRPFGVMARPVSCDGESLLLVCFIDEKEASRAGKSAAPRTRRDLSRIAELEQEAEALRLELHEANLHL